MPVLLGVVAAGRGRPPGRPGRVRRQAPQRPLRQRPPRRRAARPSSARSCAATASDAAPGRRRRGARRRCPQCRREWGGRDRRAALAAPRSASAAPPTPPPADADRRAAGRARRRAAALQRPRERARRAAASASTPRAGSPPPPRRWRRRSRSPDAPGPALPAALRRPRRRARRAGARRRARCSRAWPGAAARAGATLARWRPDSRCAIARAPGDAPQPVGRHRRLHLPRPRRRRATSRRLLSSPARAAPSSASARRPSWSASRPRRAARRRCRAPRRPRCAASRGPADAVDDRAGGAAVAAGAAAAARVAAPAVGRALPRLRRRARATALAPRRRRRAGRAQPRRPRRRAGRRRLLDRPHDRSGAAGAGAEDRRLLHRPPRRLPRARPCAAPRTRDAAARRAAARRRDGADGGGRRHRRRQRPHRGARRRALAVRAPGGRRPRPRRRLRPAPAVSGAVPPDALLNPAVFHDAMPASTIKPIMAAAFLSDPGARGARLARAPSSAAMQRDGTPARDSLRGQLMRSDSARFLDRMFCIEQGFAAAAGRGRCRRRRRRSAGTPAAPTATRRLRQGATCCSAALLGRADERGSLGARLRRRSPTAALMSEPLGRQARRADAPDAAGGARRRHPAPLRRRRRRPPPQRRRLGEVQGGAVVDVVAEGWGQGHARASALGVAGMMATLAAAANGQRRACARPHLVDAVRGVAGSARRCGRGGVGALARRAGAEPRCRARRRRGDPERPVVQPPRRHRAHRLRAGLRRAALPRHRLARRQDRHAELPERRPLARRAGAPVRDGRAAVDAEAARAAPAARCGRTSGTSPPAARPRRAGPWTKAIAVLDRAQLAARERPGPRRRRPRAEPGGRDRDADRRPRRPARSTCGAPSRRVAKASTCAATRRRVSRCRQRRPAAGRAHRREAATRLESLPAPLVWTFDGPFERCLADLEDTLRRAIVMVGDVVARRAADRPLAAGAAASRRRRRRAAAGLGPLPRTPRAATACRPCRACATCARRPAGDAGHRLSQLTCRRSTKARHVA